MHFEFATATRIIFGPGTVGQAGKLAAEMGSKALVACGLAGVRAGILMDSLSSAGIAAALFPIEGEPTPELVQAGTALARREGCDLVIGFGGGSALDSGKAIAALLTNSGDIFDYLEVVGRGRPLVELPVPYLAFPTTSGTGAEVTRNAVLGVTGQKVKVSLRSPLMLPRLAVVDPELTYSLPPSITASTGLDALTQLIEPFVSNQSNPLTDAFCREGMYRVARSLRCAYDHGDDPVAREDMSLASLFGGLALANARLGAVHGFAAPIGGMFPAPHGSVCARLLPFVMQTNVQALGARAHQGGQLRRYEEVAQILTGNAQANAQAGVTWVQELCNALSIPSLSAYGVSRQDFPILVVKAAQASSMAGNPIKLTEAELLGILETAL